jgi:hypothetical protein
MSQEDVQDEEEDDIDGNGETYYKQPVDPRDRFSIPSQELRRERYDHL